MAQSCNVCGRYYSTPTCPCTKRVNIQPNPHKCVMCSRPASVAPYKHPSSYIIPELIEKKLYCTQCYYEMEYKDTNESYKLRVNGEIQEPQSMKDCRSRWLIRKGSKSMYWNKATVLERQEALGYFKQHGRPQETILEV